MNRTITIVALVLAPVAAACATLQPPPPPELDARVRLDAGLTAYEEGRHADAFEELAWVAGSCANQEAGLHARLALASLELDPRNPGSRPAVGTELLADLIQSPRTPDWLRPTAETVYLLGLALGAPPPAGMEPEDTVPEAPAPTPVDTLADVATPEPDEPAADPAAEPAPETDPPAEPADTTPEPVVEPAPVQVMPPAPAGPVYGCGPLLEETRDTVVALPRLPGPSIMELLAEAETDRATYQERVEQLERELERIRRELTDARVELERIRRTLRP